ncbi:hypothetical protein [Nonomuraea sp. NPDC049141]|uniref:hypothetical protein n=1 Tax=unclassified Nonomuraea TaxID=2593643 RepID=UPI0033E72C0A
MESPVWPARVDETPAAVAAFDGPADARRVPSRQADKADVTSIEGDTQAND